MGCTSAGEKKGKDPPGEEKGKDPPGEEKGKKNKPPLTPLPDDAMPGSGKITYEYTKDTPADLGRQGIEKQWSYEYNSDSKQPPLKKLNGVFYTHNQHTREGELRFDLKNDMKKKVKRLGHTFGDREWKVDIVPTKQDPIKEVKFKLDWGPTSSILPPSNPDPITWIYCIAPLMAFVVLFLCIWYCRKWKKRISRTKMTTKTRGIPHPPPPPKGRHKSMCDL